jgi:hypothetical protein
VLSTAREQLALDALILARQVTEHAVAAEAIAALIAFLVSDAAAPVSGTILQACAA